ncbi:alpha/beta family hydrolase [Streptomyces sp. NPDC057638]|uniref:alpha/beta hydrolase family protein n=1 Tax=Streptomyces sp. NPDC057638 TaxID=3346190 RepID=UPI0036B8A87B
MSDSEAIETDAGTARVHWYRAREPRRVLALGHGAGGGVGARDLAGIAEELPADGVTVALVEQPWRVAGKKVAPAPATLDTGWRGVWPALSADGLPVVAGGRSAGARVACRTARELGAAAVLALSFPLHPPGRPERSRAGELLGAGVPTLVVQGANDPFGRPGEFPDGPYAMAVVPFGDHGFAVPKRSGITESETVTTITRAVRDWLAALGE